MNIINACAKYVGYEENIKSLRFEIPGKGKNPATPLFLLAYSFAAQNTSTPGSFDKGSNVLLTGRLYRRVQTEEEKERKENPDPRLYVVPTQELQLTHPNNELNQVQLAGSVWISERDGFKRTSTNKDVFTNMLWCPAPPINRDKALNHDWGTDVGFNIVAWNDDAKRFNKFLFNTRPIALGGILQFESWTSKIDGSKQGKYKVTVKNSQYSFFGDNQDVFSGEDIKKGDKLTIKKNKDKKCKEVFKEDNPDPPIASFDKPEIFDSPHQQAIAKPATNVKKAVDDGIPF